MVEAGAMGTVLGGQYRLVRMLGESAFGVTYLAADQARQGQWCVLKSFLPQVQEPGAIAQAQERFQREAGILYHLSHPQLPTFLELLRVQTSDGAQLFLVQSYVEGPTYQEKLEGYLQQGRCFAEEEVLHLLTHTLPVLAYLHSAGVVHQYVRPQSIIQRNADGLPVLINGGGLKALAARLAPSEAETPKGATLLRDPYCPPELPPESPLTPQGDLYALGVTAWVLLTGQQPLALPGWGPDPATLNQQVGPRLGAVLGRMVSPQSEPRYPSAEAVLQALQTPQTYPAPVPEPPRPEPIPTPPPEPARPVSNPVPQSRTRSGAGEVLVIGLGLLAALGLATWGVLVFRGTPEPVTQTPAPGELDPNGSPFSPEEQARKLALEQRRQGLGIPQATLVGMTDQLFYLQLPEQVGRTLSDRPEDAPLRQRWDDLAATVLDRLEGQLGAATRQTLGTYTPNSWQQWVEAVEAVEVRGSALATLADGAFTALFPEVPLGVDRSAVGQPIGQVWYALADEQVRRLTGADRPRPVGLAERNPRQSWRDRLDPGQGRVYLLSLEAGQLLRLSLQAPPGTARLSLYGPPPLEDSPLFPVAEPVTSWAGQIPQGGIYTLVVTAGPEPVDFSLDAAVDSIQVPETTSEPVPAPDSE